MYKQILRWFILERKNSSGKTVLDEFVDEFVDDPGLGTKMLQLKNLVHNTFFILKGPDASNRILVESGA
ncbi:MAG: hypothetical protein ACK4TO_02735 [Candidatus Nitrosotenuis sp.]